MLNKTLSGKSAMVTGGARRIGRGIALALAKAGANVAITYRSSHTEAAQTAREIENLGCRALAVECDVRSETSVRAAIAATIGRFGRLDVVVNNAAGFESVPPGAKLKVVVANGVKGQQVTRVLLGPDRSRHSERPGAACQRSRHRDQAAHG